MATPWQTGERLIRRPLCWARDPPCAPYPDHGPTGCWNSITSEAKQQTLPCCGSTLLPDAAAGSGFPVECALALTCTRLGSRGSPDLRLALEGSRCSRPPTRPPIPCEATLPSHPRASKSCLEMPVGRRYAGAYLRCPNGCKQLLCVSCSDSQSLPFPSSSFLFLPPTCSCSI